MPARRVAGAQEPGRAVDHRLRRLRYPVDLGILSRELIAQRHPDGRVDQFREQLRDGFLNLATGELARLEDGPGHLARRELLIRRRRRRVHGIDPEPYRSRPDRSRFP